MADERIESVAAKAERRRTEQKQEEERRQALAAAARLIEVVGEWRKIIGQSIIIMGSNGAPVEVIVKRVSDNGYLCLHVLGVTPADNPGIWVALSNVQMLDTLVAPTPLGLTVTYPVIVPVPEGPQKRARRARSEKNLTPAAITE